MLAFAAGRPAAAAAISADEVMLRSLEARNLGDQIYRAYRVELIARDGGAVTRTVSMYRKHCDGASKQLVVFREPSDIAGTAFLSWIHPHRMPDMWLYLPELGRPRQVNAATRGESFLGSDFTYEDLGAPTWDARTHLLVDAPLVDGEPTYRIESRPRAVEHYARILTWVRQTSFLPTRVEYFDARDALEKVGRYPGVRIVDGIPTLSALEMANVRTGHRTTVTLLDAEYDRPVDCAIFSQRRLTRARP